MQALGFILIAHVRGSLALTRDDLMRDLAKLPLAPDAILLNAELIWHKVEPDKLVLGAGRGETVFEVVLSLDSHGRIAGGFAPDRPHAVKASFLPTPWRGRFFRLSPS